MRRIFVLPTSLGCIRERTDNFLKSLFFFRVVSLSLFSNRRVSSQTQNTLPNTGCYFYHGPYDAGIYKWWNESDSAAPTVPDPPMAVGSEDSYIFAFYAGGQSQGEQSDGSYDPACSTLDENHFTKQLDWVNVCLGPNTLDSCSCSDCVRVVFKIMSLSISLSM